jgi:ESS family glutamate:Na+ symporter
MRVILTLHISIILGFILNEVIAAMGLKLPLFVACLLVAIVLSNSVPRFFPNIGWPARTRALAVVSDFSLGLFIAMSLMGMQLWSLVDLAGPLLILLATQALATIVFILFVLFPLMGRDYMAVVLSAGFAGFSLGATPTAIANMTAVTKSHGPAPVAFIILPLVGAFFVDITNAFVIQFFLTL